MSKFAPVTTAQIERFFEGHCTSEEAEAVSNYLQEYPEVLQWYIERDWNEAGKGVELPGGYSGEMFEKIKAHVGSGSLQKGTVVAMRRRVIGVAAAVVLLTVGMWLLWPAANSSVAKMEPPVKVSPGQTVPGQADPGQVASDQAQTQRQRVIHTNKEETLHLPDGSTVILYANSTLKYPEPFGPKRRALTLEGKAFFTVTKEETRPFVVTSGAIETTVLGTEFGVTALSEEIRVRLYSGKVRLHATDQKWRKDIVLTPGEQLEYVKKDAVAFVSNWNEEQEEVIEAPKPVILQQLIFDNEPLPQVMDKLADIYHQPITYGKQHIENIYFTGTVLTSDSLTTILHVIATMNELNIIPGKRGYIIRKRIP